MESKPCFLMAYGCSQCTIAAQSLQKMKKEKTYKTYKETKTQKSALLLQNLYKETKTQKITKGEEKNINKFADTGSAQLLLSNPIFTAKLQQ